MADKYVRSTDGNNADTGATWALAKLTLSGGAAVAAAGDRIFVSQVHAESSATAQTIASSGTTASPVQILGGNDAAEPPTALSTAPTLSTTGNTGFTFTGSFYMYGLNFICGSGGTGSVATAVFKPSTGYQIVENCSFKLNTTSATPNLTAPESSFGSSQGQVIFKNVTVSFGNAANSVGVGRGILVWNGGGLASGGVQPNNFCQFTSSVNASSTALFSNLDLTNCSSTVNIFSGDTSGHSFIRNSKLPSGWTGSLFNGTPAAGQRISMYNCDSGDTNYRLWIEDTAGSIKSETTIVRTAGASDGTTPLSWKMVGTADAEYPVVVLRTDEIVQWNETIGSSLTATIEVVTDGVTLTDADCWIEVQYLGTSGFPLALTASDAVADVLATPANQTTSTEAWTTTGLTTPTKQKLSVTFTPQEKGFIHAVVKLAKASTTVYVDPKLTVA